MQYYYFISGLPGLSIDDAKQSYSTAAFREDASKHLSAADYKLLLSLHLPDELDILLRLIYNGVLPEKPVSVYPEKYWERFLAYCKELVQNQDIKEPAEFKDLPGFISAKVVELFSQEELPPYHTTDHSFIQDAYEYLEQSGNKFIKAWFEYDAQIRNIVIAINGREHNYDFKPYLVGHKEYVDSIRRSTATDFGLGKDVETYDAVWRIYDQNNILYRERSYDVLRWKWIDAKLFFEYFSVDKILGYYSKLRILERWTSMDTDSGKESFYDTLNALSESFKIPGEFSVKALKDKN